ncbi:hypothetical protein JCM6882_004883 [Rhodosporidiobolus microsporus]
MSAQETFTRLLFSHLHPSVATHNLRSHLERCPPRPPLLTDLKVLAKPSGASRCLAFAGFKTHEDAERVRRWASSSWVAGDRGGAQVKVEWATETRDARPAKRPKLAPQIEPPQDDRFSDFMALMAPRKPLATTAAALPSAATVPSFSSAAQDQDVVDDDEGEQDRDTRASSHLSTRVGSSALPGEATVSGSIADGAAEDDSLTDAEYLARRMKRTTGEQASAVGKADGTPDEHSLENFGSGAEPASPGHDGETQRSVQDALLETGRLFVRNLPFATTAQELEDLFNAFGPVEQVHLPVDQSTQSSRGLAYVTFRQASDAVAAHASLDGTSFQGRLLHLLPAVGRATRSTERPTSTTLKDDRLAERKRASGQTFKWGTLYLNADAALASVADRLGVSKSSLLDPSASDPAVKVALAEAHTLAEIKRYFEQENVNLEAFGRPGPRSSTTILVKNLPFGTTDAALRSLVTPFGPLNRLLVPPSGTIAVVEMADGASASAAWRGLAYKQFAGSVLYLEKAPAAIWSSAPSADRPSPAPTALPAVVASSAGGGEREEAAPGATLFVKNLSFNTIPSRFRAAFDQLSDFAFARIQTKPDPHASGKTLSMGFGFVGFRRVQAATAAKDARQGYVLDGHALDIRFAQRNTDRSSDVSAAAASTAKAKGVTTKLLVKNVPFEATRAEVRQLFGAYGQLKSVRLPRKMDNKTRGFAFLEFATRRDAEAAFAALEHTHLLGRHLVLQWATEAEEEALSGEALLSSSRRGNKRKFTM